MGERETAFSVSHKLSRLSLKIDIDTEKMFSISFRAEKCERKEEKDKTDKNLRYETSV